MVGGTATFASDTLAAGTYSLTAKFVPTNGTNFTTSTSTPAIAYKVTSATNPNGRNPTGVYQPITETVKAGALTLSCTHYVTVEATAVRVCNLITLPPVTLNGVQQTKSATQQPLYVYTARGTGTSGWSLSAVMVPSTKDLGLPATPAKGTRAPVINTTCDSVNGFCNSTTGYTSGNAAHTSIPASDLKLTGFTCTPASTNANPTPTTAAGGALGTTVGICSAAAGNSGGEFEMANGTFTLTIPSTVWHGKYYGTVEYTLVSS